MTPEQAKELIGLVWTLGVVSVPVFLGMFAMASIAVMRIASALEQINERQKRQ